MISDVDFIKEGSDRVVRFDKEVGCELVGKVCEWWTEDTEVGAWMRGVVLSADADGLVGAKAEVCMVGQVRIE